MVNLNFFCNCGVWHFVPPEDVVVNITPLLGWDAAHWECQNLGGTA